MPTQSFQKPNLSAKNGGMGIDPYISVRADRASLGVSKAARQQYGAENGMYVHLAFDRTRRPWVGFLEEKTEQEEPKIISDGQESAGQVFNSTLFARHLLELMEEEPEGTVRFYFAGEEAEDPDTGATLHRLEVPGAE